VCYDYNCGLAVSKKTIYGWRMEYAKYETKWGFGQPYNPGPKEYPTNIIKILKGDSHYMILTNLGEVYTWGKNNLGQLGLGYDKDVVIDIAIKVGLPIIKKIACTQSHSMALDQDGNVYEWGHIVTPDWFKAVYTPQKIILPKIKSIACNYNYSIAISTDNNVYSWGNNNHGILGLGYRDFSIISIPHKVNISNIKKISCGRTHVMALGFDGNVWVWGNIDSHLDRLNPTQQYMRKKLQNLLIPHQLVLPSNIKVKNVVCSNQHSSAIITHYNEIYIWNKGYGKKPTKFEFQNKIDI
jgi:alpha-tubulin suppressor-like RCC1 family protein